MKKLFLSILTVFLVGAVAVGATAAWFLDTETSSGNTFSAGTLDLEVDGENPLTSAKFNVTNMNPGNQPKGTYVLTNVGSVNGYIDLENISVANAENICHEPELEAGDSTCGDPGAGLGELQDVVNLRLFTDYGCDGWISSGDNVFFNGLVNTLPGNFELDEPLNAGSSLCIVALFDWWSTASDSLAMSDSMVLDMTFELGETTGQ